MSLRSLLERLGVGGLPIRTARAQRRSNRRRGPALCLELLEERCVPALYSAVELGTLGYSYNNPADLNEAGQVVGYDINLDGATHAYLWHDGTMIDLGTLGGPYSSAAAINELGQVVGNSALPDGTAHAFLVTPQGGLWFQDSDQDGRNDLMADLGTLNGSSYSDAADINDAGQVVGGSDGHAFLWDNGVMTDLGVPAGFTGGYASGINNAGQVTGTADYYDSLLGYRSSAFLWDAASGMTALGAGPGYTDSQAWDINDAGQVVGAQWTVYAPVDPAFLWTPDVANGQTGTFTDLGMLPGAIDSNAFAINNAGQVVGSSTVTETVLVEQTTVVQQTVLVEYTVLVEAPYEPCPPGTVRADDPVYYYETYSYYETYDVYETTYAYETYYYSHAFLWDAAGGMVDLQDQLLPGSNAILQNPVAINDGGSIAVNGDGRAYLLTPIPPGTPLISIAGAPAATEGNAGTAEATFTVTLLEAGDLIVTVDFTTAANSALAGSDFVPRSGTLTFLPGETSKPIPVDVLGDLLNEGTEFFSVQLSNPTNSFIEVFQATGVISDDDPLPELSVNDVAIAEGNAGTSNALFTVSLSAPSGRWISVTYYTADGAAQAGSDYQSRSGWLSFAPGVTSQTIAVPIIGDVRDESDESFSVNLSGAGNAVIADSAGVGKIINDDPPSFAISDQRLVEGSSGMTSFLFTVTLSRPYSQDMTVEFETFNGSATAGSATAGGDYQYKKGTLTFLAGQTSQTILITVYGDTTSEGEESFYVKLKNPSAGVTLSDDMGWGFIENDDKVSKRRGPK